MLDRIYDLIENPNDTKAGNIYAVIMSAVIVISLIPLAFKESSQFLKTIELATGCIFILDYLLRISIAPKKLNKGAVSYVLYPFTPMAIIDLIAIITSFTALLPALRALKILRLIGILRAIKLLRYSKNFKIVCDVIEEQRDPLLAVCSLAVVYVLISALVIFNVEPETFSTYFDAIYWATVSLTTMGYGDIYATSVAGKIITMISAFMGIAIIALPSGIITAGYMDRISRKDAEGNVRDKTK